MAKVFISEFLFKQIEKKFNNSEANNIVDLMISLEDNPKKGKSLTHVGNIIIKELKHKKFRFYFITDGNVLKFGTEDELASLLIKFIRMSDKKEQEKTIKKIKNILTSFGFEDL